MTPPPPSDALPREAERVLSRVRSIAACGNKPPCSVCQSQIFAISRDLEAFRLGLARHAGESARLREALEQIHTAEDLIELEAAIQVSKAVIALAGAPPVVGERDE